MQKIRSDVVVVGGGPAGSTTSKTIAKNGFDVLLVEKDDFPGKTNVCAGGMPRSVIEDTGLNISVIEKEISGEKHHFPWGLREGKLDHITVYRNVFDRSLADQAVEYGAKMLTNTLVRDISVKNDEL